MSSRQNRNTPSTQKLERYPQTQDLIDPVAYGALEQKVENQEKRIEFLEKEVRENRDRTNILKGWTAALMVIGAAIGSVVIWAINVAKDLFITH